MSDIEIRHSPSYPNDPGDGVRITAKDGTVEIGVTWDGAERFVAHVPAEQMAEIAFRASHWPRSLKQD